MTLQNWLKPEYLRVVNIILILLIVLFVVKLVLLLSTKPADPEITIKQPMAQRGVSFSLYSETFTRQEELPKARIKAKVLGLVNSGNKSYATILLEGRKQSVYKVGDQIEVGVTVEEIDNAGVVVREQGALRRIPIDRLGSNQHVQVIESMISESMPSVKNLDEILAAIEITLDISDGVTGLKIRRIPESLTNILDIRAGDVITAVDNIQPAEFSSDQKPMKILADKFSEGGVVTIDLMSDGNPRQVQIDSSRFDELLNP